MSNLVEEMHYLNKREDEVKVEIENLNKILELNSNPSFNLLLKDLDNSIIEATGNLVIPQIKENALSVLLGISRFKEHLSVIPARLNSLRNELLDIAANKESIQEQMHGE